MKSHTAGSRPLVLEADDVYAVESVMLADRNLPNNTYDLLARTAAAYGDRPALHLLDHGDFRAPETWIYRDLLGRVTQAANLYTEAGLSLGGTVGLLLPNTGAIYSAILGAQAVGIAAPVNPHLSARHIADILTLTGAEILVTAGPTLDPLIWTKALEVSEHLTQLRAILAVGGGGAESPPGFAVYDFEHTAAMQSATHLRCDFSPESTDVAGYFHTGGTTGAPKIVPLTHHNQTYMAWALGCSGAYLDGAVILGGLPLFHVNALHVTGLGPFMHGRPVVSLGPAGYRDSRLMAEFWRIIEHYRVTTFSAVPTVYASLPPIPAEANISSLRGGAVGSAPLPARVRSTFEETTKVPMIEGWGLTEATCTSTATPVVAPRPGSVGQRLPYQRVKAVELDTDGSPIADCAEGQPGVLAIKGPNVFPGYLRAGRTGPVLDPAGKIYNGWLVTGDLGHVDRDGYVYLTGRAGDLIIRGGHNIDPIPIEDSLLAHPAISAAAVVGHPDPHSGEVPAAYVTLHPDAHPDHSELTVWAVEHAPEPAAAPKYLHIVGTLPTTGIGKVHKNALREDAVRRAVVNELTTLGVTGTVLVTTRDGRPEADIDLTADQTKSETLRDSLDRYTFSYRINASHERHDRQGAS